MEKNSSYKTISKTKKVGFNSNAPKPERVSLAEDLSGCVLVIPQISWRNKHIMPLQGGLSEDHL